MSHERTTVLYTQTTNTPWQVLGLLSNHRADLGYFDMCLCGGKATEVLFEVLIRGISSVQDQIRSVYHLCSMHEKQENRLEQA